MILALQASDAVHLGIDNLNVGPHVGRLLDGVPAPRPFQLDDDGDLIGLIRKILCSRGEETVCIFKVEGHAEEELVRRGQVWELDRDVNNRADEAADFGRRRVWPDVIDARRNLSGVCERWCPVIMDLHRFFFNDISRAVVSAHDSSGIAPDHQVWSVGGLPKMRRVVRAVRDAALLPGPASIWESGSVCVLPTSINAGDVGLWPYSAGALVKLAAFVGTLHWPASGADLGVGGVSYVELLVLYELWAGERLRLEKAVPRGRRIDRPISVSAVPPGPGIDIGRSCRFLGGKLRALGALPGGLGRFTPCGIGANHCRLRRRVGEVWSRSYL